MKLSIILPTYNERENLRPLVKEILIYLPNAEIIIVDDNSPDGTGTIAEKLSEDGRVFVLHRKERLGLTSALSDGLSKAKGEIICFMDADGSHSPFYLPLFLNEIDKGADMVLGSRYMPGGGVQNWTFFRHLLSKLAIRGVRFLTSVSDPMSGFIFFRREVMEDVKIQSKGYKVGLEILVKGNHRVIKEIPYIFRNRIHGKSKFGPREFFRFCRDFLTLHSYKVKLV